MSTTRQVGLLLGPALFVVMLVLPPPEGLPLEGWRTAAVGLLMAVWWITEALPIPATALLPIVLLPYLGITGIGDATAPYANPVIFLFMGGFILAIGMQEWGLHRRIALTIIRVIGTRPTSILLGFMIASAFLSMWVSNTSTVLMMLPIAVSIIDLMKRQGVIGLAGTRSNFELVLMLVIAYGCNIGGMGTLVGTPPNALLAGFFSETYGIDIGFARWMMIGVPLVVVSIPLAFLLLTRVLYPIRVRSFEGGQAVIMREWKELGPMSIAEKRVAAIFALTALLWMTRPLLANALPMLSDAGIAMTAAIALFLAPSGSLEKPFLLDWPAARALPWGVLILFGGGLSLAGAISDTGLATYLGERIASLPGWPTLAVLLLVVTLVVFLTEITSNTATAAAFLPILASVALGMDQNPLLFTVPAALAASCAFMLPVATPPNAIVYGTGHVTIGEMSKTGLWLNLLFIILITLITYLLVGLVFGVEVSQHGAQHLHQTRFFT
ncbi:DASS family sodium-coupled anion symporter [Rhodocaloribacter litoris]|nr:DASS family sodium-coupled anion symporter [Rhodocaloribacter litoris]